MRRAAILRCRHGSQSGYVLIVALFVMVVTLTASLLIAASMTRQMQTYRLELRDARLTALADGALSMALARLWRDPDWEGTSEPFGDGMITIENRKIDGLNIEVSVSVTYGIGGRAARARVRVSRKPQDERPPPRVLSWEPVVFQPEDSDRPSAVGR